MLRNVRLYVLLDAQGLDPDRWATAVRGTAWAPLPALSTFFVGFTCLPGPKEQPTAPELVEVAGWHLARVRVTERKIAKKAVQDALEVRVAEYVERAGQPPSRTETKTLQHEIEAQLRAKAPPQSSYYWAGLHPERRLMLFDGSAALADDVLSALRSALGSFPVAPASFGPRPAATLREWVSDPEVLQTTPISLGFSARFQDAEDTDHQVAVKGEYLADSELAQEALAAGLQVSSLRLSMDVGGSLPLCCTLTASSELRQIVWPAAELPEEPEDPDNQFAAELFLKASQLNLVIDILTEHIGGIPLPEAEGQAA